MGEVFSRIGKSLVGAAVLHVLSLANVGLAAAQRAEAATAEAATDEPTSAPIDFQSQIRPLLSDRCFACHGPDAKHREADLRLDLREAAVDLLAPQQLADSEVWRRITSEDPDERMPPPDSGKELSAAERRLLRQWIEQGAPYTPYWAYEAPRWRQPPSVSRVNWPANWIDHFILARLEQVGASPAPDADEVTLLRRVHFDLTGLPPSPETVHAYLNDHQPDKYEKLVDRLLESPAYGQRMAMYWLDLVRYADTVGYHGDQDHSIAPYRDWVIDAFNANLPFDQFTIEQLAGDLLPEPTLPQRIATGYNRLLQTSHEGGVQPKEYLAIYAADRVRNVSSVWLGGTLGCAQCHDHKFDPFTTKDFYAMSAFFADIDEEQHFKVGSNSLPTARPPEITVWTAEQRELLASLKGKIAALEQQLAPAKASDTHPPATSEPDGDAEEARRQLATLVQQRKQVEALGRRTMVTVSKETPRVTRILPRGNWLDDSGEIVAPAPPEFLGRWSHSEPSGDRSNRLDLARWLTDPEQGVGGLTARVFVNRWWYLMLGEGLARVLDDFGGQGEPPTHPELLDALAVSFHESGWDVRRLVRLIVLSRTYQQSSVADASLVQRDPYNRLLARQARFRLPAEMIRDSALMISGLLVDEFGGASVKPYQPGGYYRHLNFPQRKYQHDVDQRQWRRGVYVHWQRQFLHPMLKAMDAPSREECTAKRPHSNTPLAALVLLNDPTFVEAARVFADRVLQEGGPDDDHRLTFACEHVLSRRPDERERDLLQRLLQANRETFAGDPDRANQLLSVGLAPTHSTQPASERASWTMVCRALLNMSEAITRN